MSFVLDSFAWLELVAGSEKGEKVRTILKGRNPVFTTAANLYEVYYRASEKYGGGKAEETVVAIREHSEILAITPAIAIIAAKIRLSHGLSAIDAFTLAAARQHDAKVVTGDPDFARFKEDVLML